MSDCAGDPRCRARRKALAESTRNRITRRAHAHAVAIAGADDVD